MSIADVTAERNKYVAEMCTKYPPPIYRAQIFNAYMDKVIEVLTALETSIDSLDTKIDALETRVETLEG